MTDVQPPPGKFMMDPYLEWTKGEGVSVYEDIALNLFDLETKPWARFGVKGAIAHVSGRGDFMTVFVIEIPPGGKTAPEQHIYESAVYVLSGHGSTTVETSAGVSHTFEWGPHSIFAPPLNAKHQHFNGSGQEPVLLAVSCNLPAVLNLFHSESFVFNNPCSFPEREGRAGHFTGDGDFIRVRPGKHMWETNFVPNATTLQLESWAARGAGASNIKVILADGILHCHLSDMPVGTYKKAHRHTPDTHVYCVTGEGYSLLWYEGDRDFTRVDWKHGWVFAPPDMMFHQHFNTCAAPVRYLAFAHGSLRYPFTQNIWDVFRGVDLDVKKGGKQIEYQDQDPRVHEVYVRELAKKGLTPNMDAFVKPVTASAG